MLNNFGGMTQLPHWFVWRLSGWNGKKFTEKVPVRGLSPVAFDAANRALTLELDDALDLLDMYRERDAAGCYALGWYVHTDSGYWFVDIDNCVDDAGVCGAVANDAMLALPGCLLEYSSSRHGIHIIGRGALPAGHRTRGGNMPDGMEIYSGGRGICFGLGLQFNGCADVAGVPPWVVTSTPQGPVDTVGVRMDEWRGPEDDDELIRRMLARNEAGAMLRGKHSIAALWSGEGVPHDSDSDGALAMHLAWWTGCDMPRMVRMMWRSGLVRDKWYKHKTYLEITCRTACLGTKGCYVQPGVATVVSAPLVEVLHEVGNIDELRAAVAGYDTSGLDAVSRHAAVVAIQKKSSEIGCKLPIGVCRDMLPVGGSEASEDMPEWAREWCHVQSDDRYYRRGSDIGMTRTALHAAMCHMPGIPKKDNGLAVNVLDMFERWGVPSMNDFGYCPHASGWYTDDIGISRFNTYRPFAVGATWNTDASAVFEQHVLNVCNGNTEYAAIVLKWMAHIVQRPGVLQRWGLLVMGKPGTGKSMLSKPLEMAVGRSNVKHANSRTVNNSGKFMDWACDSQLLGVISDLALTGPDRFEAAEAMKPVISDDVVTVTKKGARDLIYTNYAHYVVSTNSLNPIPETKGERRFMSLRTSMLDEGMGGEYYKRLADAIAANTGEQWAAWFSSFDLTGFDYHTAPITDVAQVITDSNISDYEMVVEEVVNGYNVVTSNVLREHLIAAGETPGSVRLNRVLMDLGYTKHRSRKTIPGVGKVTIYVRGCISENDISKLAKEYATNYVEIPKIIE